MKAIIFDLDGTLVDSDVAWFNTYQKIANNLGKGQIKKEHYEHFVHSGEIYKWFVSHHNIQMNEEEFWKEVDQYFNILMRDGVLPIEGAIMAVKRLSNDFRLAIASSASAKYADYILEELEIRDLFEVIVGAEDVSTTKPYPDVYLETLKRLNLSAQECLAVEDSVRGLKAAKAAGIKCVVIPYHKDENLDFKEADLILLNLKDLTSDLLKNLM